MLLPPFLSCTSIYNDIVIAVDNDDIVDDHGDVDDNHDCMNCRTCRTTTASTRQTSPNPRTFSSTHRLLRWLLMIDYWLLMIIVKRWHWYVSSACSRLWRWCRPSLQQPSTTLTIRDLQISFLSTQVILSTFITILIRYRHNSYSLDV